MASTVSWPTSEGFWVDFEAPILVDLPVKVSGRERHSPVPAGPREDSPLTWTRALSSGRTPLPAEIGDLPCAQGLVEITSHDVHTFAQAEVTDHQYQVDTDGRTTGAGVVDVDAHDGKVISATSHGPRSLPLATTVPRAESAEPVSGM